MPITLERKLPVILFFAFLMMATIGYVSYRNTSELNGAIQLEKHTQKVIIKLDETLISVVDIETGMRGFFLSADEKYLVP
jgi:CHASE3 domain sensor protein